MRSKNHLRFFQPKPARSPFELADPSRLDSLPGSSRILPRPAPVGWLPVEGLSLDELSSLFFGDWVVSRSDFIGGTSTQTFTVSPFLDDVFSEIPTITSPVASGEEITVAASSVGGGNFGADFTLEWSYPSGSIPSSRLLRRGNPGGGGGDYSVDFIRDSNSLLFSAVLDPGVSSTVFNPSVGAFESIDSFVSDVVSDDPAANVDLVTVGAEFRTLSQIAVINVAIPEPNTFFISLLAMTVIANRRRKA